MTRPKQEDALLFRCYCIPRLNQLSFLLICHNSLATQTTLTSESSSIPISGAMESRDASFSHIERRYFNQHMCSMCMQRMCGIFIRISSTSLYHFNYFCIDVPAKDILCACSVACLECLRPIFIYISCMSRNCNQLFLTPSELRAELTSRCN